MQNQGYNLILKWLLMLYCVCCYSTSYARSSYSHLASDPVQDRATMEEKIKPNFFLMTAHRPNYIFPYYYTTSPYQFIYRNMTPFNAPLNHTEMKYQFSFKIPIWKNIIDLPTTLYFGYTQLSYWQAYNKSAFFRETDFEPEIFFANQVNIPLFGQLKINNLNLGAVHQSNGKGDALERSWNRLYLESIATVGNWVVTLKPWLIFKDKTYRRQNPDLKRYTGYGSLNLGYKFGHHVVALDTRNVLESGGKRMGLGLSWGFPLTHYLKGYAQIFTGYGQSLIEYNHRTTSLGVGIALSDWF